MNLGIVLSRHYELGIHESRHSELGIHELGIMLLSHFVFGMYKEDF